MDRIKVFDSILSKFETDEMRLYCEDMIMEIPDYIFEIPSSTSYKYHNKTQCQPHGQIYHILMFGEIMNYLLGLDYMIEKYPTPKQRDCFRCTPIFHDAIKCGLNGSQYTVHEHPLLAGKWIRTTKVEHDISDKLKDYIAKLCESHSGQWTTSKKSSVVLPHPENDAAFLVHLCDYLSSRSNLDMTYPQELYQKLGVSGQDADANTNETVDTYVFHFGKHNGKKLSDVIKQDPSYIAWAKENIERQPLKSLLEGIEVSA